MSFRFPRWEVNNLFAIEIDDINESFSDMIEEEAGYLNEHNFANGAIPNRFWLKDSAAINAYSGYTEDTGTPYTYPNELTAQTVQIPQDGGWHSIVSTTATVISSGGLLWVVASFQYAAIVTSTDYLGAACWFGIRVNGQLIPESVIGSQEIEQDQGSNINDLTPGAGNFNTPVPCWGKMPVRVDAMLPIAPGAYTVDFAAMITPTSTFAPGNVQNCEIVALEFVNG